MKPRTQKVEFAMLKIKAALEDHIAQTIRTMLTHVSEENAKQIEDSRKLMQMNNQSVDYFYWGVRLQGGAI